MLALLIVLGIVVIYCIPAFALWRAGRKPEARTEHSQPADCDNGNVPGFNESVRWTHFVGTLSRMNAPKMPTNNHFEETRWYESTSVLHSSR